MAADDDLPLAAEPGTPQAVASAGPVAAPSRPGALGPDAGRRATLWLALLAGLLLALALALGIAWKRGSFDATQEVYTVVPNAVGLSPGTAVRLSGVRIGAVRSLTLQPDLSVKLVMRIDANLFPRLHADARAQVVRDQLRPAAIELEPGTSPQGLNREDPRVALHDKASLSEMADELRGRLLPILDDLKSTTGMLRQRQGDMAAVLAHAASAAEALARSANEVNGLTAHTRGQVAEMGSQAVNLLGQANSLMGQGTGLLAQGNGALGKVNALIGQVDASLGIVNTALPGLMGKADNTLEQLNAVARDARTITGSAAQALPPVLRAVPPLVDEAQDMVIGLRSSWALRSLLGGNAVDSAEWPIDSLDAGALREPLPRR